MSVQTVATRVRCQVETMPKAVAMRVKHLGIWHEITWEQYWETVLDVGHALLALGVEPGDRVSIQSENRPEWLFLDVAAVAVRGTAVGMYPTNPTAETGYLLANSGASVHLAEDQEQVDKALDVTEDLPELRKIIYVEARGMRNYDDPRLMSWTDLVELGQKHRADNPGAVEERMAQATEDDVVTLVYTSGTTGPPKGAMLSVRNVEFALEAVLERSSFCDPTPGPKDVTLSYLPLCHAAERMFTTWYNAGAGTQVNFAESIDTVPQNLKEVQPTLFFAVPRIWEKLLAAAQTRLESATWFKRKWSAFWLRRAEKIGATLVQTGGNHTAGTRIVYAIGWVFFFRALRNRLGLRLVRHAGSGAAPIAPEVLEFFMGLGVPLHELYGMTENTGMATANRPGRVKLGTVGEAHEGIEVKLDGQTGEILTRHPANFAGYWRNPEATAETLDEDGWLHTGDVGEWVDGTHLKITGRMKDIIITSGGKNVSPSEIENSLKASPFIKEAVVIGDGRKYLTALIGIEPDTVAAWAESMGIGFTTYRDLSEKQEVIKLVQRVVDESNSHFNPVEQIKAFRLLPRELDHDQGELTATQKVKRPVINDKYGELIGQMYGEPS